MAAESAVRLAELVVRLAESVVRPAESVVRPAESVAPLLVRAARPVSAWAVLPEAHRRSVVPLVRLLWAALAE